MRLSIRGGERINMDALLADRGLANASRDLAQAKYNYLLSFLRLKQQAGNLTTDDLQLVAAYFERDTSIIPLPSSTQTKGSQPNAARSPDAAITVSSPSTLFTRQ